MHFGSLALNIPRGRGRFIQRDSQMLRVMKEDVNCWASWIPFQAARRQLQVKFHDMSFL